MHTTDDITSPQSSDNEKTEEIVTKFERSPDGREAKKVTTKRTILRKKGKKTVSEYSPGDKNNGDVIIEEMWDDDNQDVKPDKMSPTYENISIEECEPNTEEFNSQVNERATVEFEDDEKLVLPECSEVVNIEEIFPENEKIIDKIILSKPLEESSTTKIVKKLVPKKKKMREEKIETVTSYDLEDDLMTSVIIENEYYIEPLDSPINIKRKKSTFDTKKLTKMGLVPCKIEHKQQIAKKIQVTDTSEIASFALVKLSKTPRSQRQEVKATTVPKILLKSRIKYVGDWPPAELHSVITFIGSMKDVGILSRNTKEALKIKRKQYKPVQLPDFEITTLEKPSFTIEDIIKTNEFQLPEVRKIESVSVKNAEIDEPRQFTIKKGVIPNQDDTNETITLKKIPVPIIPEEEHDIVTKKINDEKNEVKVIKSPEKPIEFDDIPSLDLDLNKIDKEIYERSPENDKIPEDNKDTEKYTRPEKKKKAPESIPSVLKKGIPKIPVPDEQENVTFRKPTPTPTVEEIEKINLKPFDKKPVIDDTENVETYDLTLSPITGTEGPEIKPTKLQPPVDKVKKRVIKQKLGAKDEITEITTTELDGEEPLTSIVIESLDSDKPSEHPAIQDNILEEPTSFVSNIVKQPQTFEQINANIDTLETLEHSVPLVMESVDKISDFLISSKKIAVNLLENEHFITTETNTEMNTDAFEVDKAILGELDEVTLEKPSIDYKNIISTQPLTKKDISTQKQEEPQPEESVTIKPKLHVDSEDVENLVIIPKKTTTEEDNTSVKIKRKKKEKKEDIASDVIAIIKPVIQKEDTNIEEESVNFKLKSHQKEEEDVENVIILPKKSSTEEESASVEIKMKKRDKIEDMGSDEILITKPAIQNEDVPTNIEEEESVASVKLKPRQKPKQSEIHEEEEITIKKLKPIRKVSTPNIVEITEPESVTFRPKSTKTKEDVEQEFKIHLDSYAEEEISMSSKVKLKSQKLPTFTEESGETSIKIVPVSEEIDEEIVIEENKEIYDENEPIDEVEPDTVTFKPTVTKPKEDVEPDTITVKPKITKPKEDEEPSAITLKPKITKPKEDVEPETITLKPKTTKPKEDVEPDTITLKPKITKPKEDEEPDTVTFKPKSSKSKEDVEQEFKIKLDSYAEEEISLSGKVILKPKKQPIYNEQSEETSIQLRPVIDNDQTETETEEQENVDEDDNQINLKLSKTKDEDTSQEFKLTKKPKKIDSGEAKETVTIRALVDEPDNISLKLNLKKKSYNIQDEDEVSFDIKAQQEMNNEEDVSLSSQIKIKNRIQPSYSEETGETSIKLTKEVEDNGPFVDEIILSESESEEHNIEMVLKKKKQEKKYQVNEHEEEIMLGIKPTRKISQIFDEDNLTLSKKRPAPKPAFDQGYSLYLLN